MKCLPPRASEIIFDYCVQFKRPGKRGAGAAIYLKQNNSHMNITYCQTCGLGIITQNIGDKCTAECLFENG